MIANFSPESALFLHVHPTVLRTIERFRKFWTVLKSSQGPKLTRARTLSERAGQGNHTCAGWSKLAPTRFLVAFWYTRYAQKRERIIVLGLDRDPEVWVPCSFVLISIALTVPSATHSMQPIFINA